MSLKTNFNNRKIRDFRINENKIKFKIKNKNIKINKLNYNFEIQQSNKLSFDIINNNQQEIKTLFASCHLVLPIKINTQSNKLEKSILKSKSKNICPQFM